jgi:hypothetical protein
MIHMYIEIDVDADNCLYRKLIDYTWMLSIGCKPMILIILTLPKTCLKVFKFNCCRLMNHLPLESFACLEV